MDKLTKENIIKLSKDLSINLSEDDINYILKASNSYEKHVKAIKDFKIDEKIEPMHYPYDCVKTELRDDNQIHNLKKEEILSVSPQNDGEYVLIDRVVK